MGWLGGGGMLATDHDFIALDMMRWVGGGGGGVGGNSTWTPRAD